MWLFVRVFKIGLRIRIPLQNEDADRDKKILTESPLDNILKQVPFVPAVIMVVA